MLEVFLTIINVYERKKGKKPNEEKTYWHNWIGDYFKIRLSDVNIDVRLEYPVMTHIPKADILILNKKNKGRWTKAQYAKLPDGIRGCSKQHILIELKYTESLNINTFLQVFGYYFFYKRSKELKNNQIGLFIISSKSPSKKTLKEYAYKKTKLPGVYKSKARFLNMITIISLNDLSKEAHNIQFKLFASKKREQIAATNSIKLEMNGQTVSKELLAFFIQFINGVLNKEGGVEVDWINLSEKDRNNIIESFEENIIQNAGIEKRLKGVDEKDVVEHFKPKNLLKHCKPKDVLQNYEPKDVLKHYKPKDVLKNYEPKDVLKHYKPKDVLKNYEPKDVLKHYKPKDVLKNYKPKDVLKHYKPKDVFECYNPKDFLDDIDNSIIEAYLATQGKKFG